MISTEGHVDAALAQQRPVYRRSSIDDLTTILVAPFDDLEAAFSGLVEARQQGLRGSGIALDLAGGIVALRRNGLDDLEYRLALAARIASLNSSGTPEDVIAVVRSVVPQSVVRPSVVRVQRGTGHVVVELVPGAALVVPDDWVTSPTIYVAEALDSSFNAGDATISVAFGLWPETGRFSVHGGAYTGERFAFVASATRTTLTIAPPLPHDLDGTEELRLLGLDMPALRYVLTALFPAVHADASPQVAGGLVGAASAFALNDAIATSSSASAGATVLLTSVATTAQLPAAGYCHPAGSPVTRYRVTAPGVLSLDSALVTGVSAGAIVPLVDASGSGWRPGAGLGVGSLYGVAG